METSLLTTKLNIPPLRSQLVSRPRLIKLLDESLDYSLILVSAPAGFGKTTLVSEWAHQNRQQPTAWLSIDAEDNDPVRFWDYFITALQTLQPDCGEKVLPFLHSSQQPAIEPILTEIINDLTAITSKFILVLDDYHLIESKSIHDGITYLLEHMPAQMHLVIASRADPPLPLARFRAKRMMFEIGANNLRFDQDEVTELFRELRIVELSLEDIKALNTRTEGWAAGLIMAAISLRGQEDIEGMITKLSGSQRYVMDYLIEEVLKKQTADIREFLLKTSVLERLSGPLCDVITGKEGSQGTLLEIERGHLFLVPLDESRQWYRYEHLFADLLRHQCEITYGKEQVITLHQKASQWYEENNLPEDAIHHTLVARDWESAVRLISEHGKDKQQIGEAVTLYNWMLTLPEEVKLAHLELCKLYIIATSMAGHLDDVESILRNLEKVAQDDDNIKDLLAVQQTMLAWRRHDYRLAGELAKKALLNLPLEDIENVAIMSLILGWVANMNGKFAEAEVLFAKSFNGFRQMGEDFGASSAYGGLMSNIYRKGKLRRMAKMAEQRIERFGASPVSGVSHIALGMILYEWNELDGAIDHVQKTIDMERLIGSLQGRVGYYNTLALYKLSLGDKTGFLEASIKADIEARDIGESSMTQTQHIAYHIKFAIKQDDLETASGWGKKLSKNIGALQYDYKHIPLRLLIAQGKKAEAAEELRVLYDEAVKSESWRYMIIYRIYQSLAAENEESAVEFLSDALTVAEPEGYIRSFVDEGKLLKPLLEKALSKGITPEYTRKLITIVEAEERQKRMRQKKEGISPQEKALLSEREIEVLKLMAEGFANQQIADRLFISLGTTKNHVHNIIEKLEAKGRTQAIAQARELELI